MTSHPLSRRAALALPLTALAACARPAVPTSPSVSTTSVSLPRTGDGRVPALTVRSRVRSGRVERWVLGTPALPADLAVNVVLPASYDANPQRRYPVLYLLHGSDADASAWLQGDWLVGLLARREVIAVLPDGGAFGWYVDWLQQAPPVLWESVHVGALVPSVDRTYRTIPTAAGRGVVGISMGGFGAIHYAQAYPDVFGAVTSLSGAVSLRQPKDYVALDAQALPGKPPFAIFGEQPDAKAAAVDPPLHARTLHGRRVRLYCGDGVTPAGPDATETAMLAGNRRFADALRAAGVDHRLVVLPGAHDWGVWRRAFAQDLPELLGALAPPA